MKTKHKIIAVIATIAAVSGGVYLANNKLDVGVKGATNPDITQANIQQTICNPNFRTSSIRPPTSYTNPLKAKLCQEQNCGDAKNYELDHIIAITNAGHPTDPKNLQLQPYEPRPNAHEKDQVEVYIHKKICSGELTLKEGQRKQAQDWLNIYNNEMKNKLGGIGIEEDADDQ